MNALKFCNRTGTLNSNKHAGLTLMYYVKNTFLKFIFFFATLRRHDVYVPDILICFPGNIVRLMIRHVT